MTDLSKPSVWAELVSRGSASITAFMVVPSFLCAYAAIGWLSAWAVAGFLSLGLLFLGLTMYQASVLLNRWLAQEDE